MKKNVKNVKKVKKADAPLLFDWRAHNDDELIARLQDCMDMTARSITEAASIVAELERRGRDLDGFGLRYMECYRGIATGQILPELLANFFGRSAAVATLSALPLDEQKRVAEGGKLAVRVIKPDGAAEMQEMAPENMTPAQLRQVVSPAGRIRSAAEQDVLIKKNKAQRRAKIKKFIESAPQKVGSIEIDIERNGAYHKGELLPFADLKKVVRILEKASKGRK